jgi:hypothetical protein
MRRAHLWHSSALVGFVLFAATQSSATEPFAKVGHAYAASWLKLPLGARNIGMGGTGTADASGFGTGYYNPAVISFANATIVSGGYQDFARDIGIYDATLLSPIPFNSDSTAGDWRFAGSLGYTRLSLAPQTERTIFLPEGTGRTFDASDWIVRGIGATSWTHGVTTLSAGASGKFFRSNLANSSSDVWMLDLGTLAAFAFDFGNGATVRPRLAYALLNLDSGASYKGRDYLVENQSRVGFGFDLSTPTVHAWDKRVPSVSLSFDYDDISIEDRSSDTYAAGVELSIVDLMHIRYGTVDDDYRTYGVGFGWDWGRTLLRVDYAHQNPGTGIDYVSGDRDTYAATVGMRW